MGNLSWTIDILAAAIIPCARCPCSTTIFQSGRGKITLRSQAIGTFLEQRRFFFGLEIGTASLFAGTLVGQLASVVVSLAALGLTSAMPAEHAMAFGRYVITRRMRHLPVSLMVPAQSGKTP
ncbi:hypothetical protein [Bradyrhizobium sp. RDT46]|uniref:hypothetical protein n=1 Tax=Bradyrhizobium sp. RDT46 TaxID=3341829 RepID=UPI0035C71344